MQTQPLFFLGRIAAALCHLAGLIWLPIAFAFLSIVPIFTQNLTLLTICLFSLSTIAMMLASLVTFLTWKANRDLHPFVNRAGRCAINSISSHSLYLFVVSILVSITYDSFIKSTVSSATLFIYPLIPIISMLNVKILGTTTKVPNLIVDLILIIDLIDRPLMSFLSSPLLILISLMTPVFGFLLLSGIFAIAINGFPVLFVLIGSIIVPLPFQLVAVLGCIVGEVYSYPFAIKFLAETLD